MGKNKNLTRAIPHRPDSRVALDLLCSLDFDFPVEINFPYRCPMFDMYDILIRHYRIKNAMLIFAF